MPKSVKPTNRYSAPYLDQNEVDQLTPQGKAALENLDVRKLIRSKALTSEHLAAITNWEQVDALQNCGVRELIGNGAFTPEYLRAITSSQQANALRDPAVQTGIQNRTFTVEHLKSITDWRQVWALENPRVRAGIHDGTLTPEDLRAITNKITVHHLRDGAPQSTRTLGILTRSSLGISAEKEDPADLRKCI